MDLSQFESKIKINFKNQELLRTALTHRSYLNEHRSHPLPHNERLEFLGDAVLELITTEYLYLHFDNPEGELTNLRSALVNYRMLAEVARRVGMEDFLLLSKGEARDTGRARQVILANAVEAVIGAIYLDQGIGAAKSFVDEFIIVELSKIVQDRSYLDPKSKLQEIIQDKMTITPIYTVLSESGPDHDKIFEVGVRVGDKIIGQGTGSSKQEAEVSAAQDALIKNNF